MMLATFGQLEDRLLGDEVRLLLLIRPDLVSQLLESRVETVGALVEESLRSAG